MGQKNIFIVLALILITGMGAFFFFERRSPDTPMPQEARMAPDLTLQDYEGREVKLSDFQGKNAVINAWASWCPFCREEMADFAALQKEFGDKIVVIAIDRAEPLEAAKQYSDGLGVSDKFIFLLDPTDSFYQAIGGFSMPETIFVDKDGFIRYHKRGPMKLEEMKRRVEDAFNI